MDQALCVGQEPEDFFPKRGQSVNDALLSCFHCPVRVECDDYRTRTKSTFGIWAGKLQKRGDDII